MKHRFRFYLLLSCVVPVTVTAQDSLLQYSQLTSLRNQFFTSNLVVQPLYREKDFATVEAGFKRNAGSFRQAQQAPATNNFFFSTAGTRRINKYLLSGSFTIDKVKRDSAAFALRYDWNNPSPYYFYAIKKGNWDASTYTLNGIASRYWLKDKLVTAGSFDYRSGNAWRSNDPRPENYWHSMNVQLSAGYKIGKHVEIGIAGGIVRNSTETSIDYRNSDYSLSLLYKDYVNYLQYGYGFGVIQTSNRNIRSTTTGFNWQGMANAQTKAGQFTVFGGYQQSDSRYFRSGAASENEITYGWFYEDVQHLNLHWQKRKGNSWWSATASYKNHLGRDFNRVLNGNNYVYSSESIHLRPMYGHLSNGRMLWDAGIQASISNLYKADGTVGQIAEYQQWQTVATVSGYLYPKGKGQLFKVSATAGMQAPISQRITVPAQQTDFTKAVVFHDYYYFTAKALSTGAEVLYASNIHTINAFVKAGFTYINATLLATALPASQLPGNYNTAWQIAAGITF